MLFNLSSDIPEMVSKTLISTSKYYKNINISRHVFWQQSYTCINIYHLLFQIPFLHHINLSGFWQNLWTPVQNNYYIIRIKDNNKVDQKIARHFDLVASKVQEISLFEQFIQT